MAEAKLEAKETRQLTRRGSILFVTTSGEVLTNSSRRVAECSSRCLRREEVSPHQRYGLRYRLDGTIRVRKGGCVSRVYGFVFLPV